MPTADAAANVREGLPELWSPEPESVLELESPLEPESLVDGEGLAVDPYSLVGAASAPLPVAVEPNPDESVVLSVVESWSFDASSDPVPELKSESLVESTGALTSAADPAFASSRLPEVAASSDSEEP